MDLVRVAMVVGYGSWVWILVHTWISVVACGVLGLDGRDNELRGWGISSLYQVSVDGEVKVGAQWGTMRG